jgi:hypothetical protein
LISGPEYIIYTVDNNLSCIIVGGLLKMLL